MNINRKEFFKKSLFSLGEAFCSVSNALKTSVESAPRVPDTSDFISVSRNELVAVAYNDGCLAKNSGCFACVERCETSAIRLVPGIGIRINPLLCTGCSTCEYVCPVTPKAVKMQSRKNP